MFQSIIFFRSNGSFIAMQLGKTYIWFSIASIFKPYFPTNQPSIQPYSTHTHIIDNHIDNRAPSKCRHVYNLTLIKTSDLIWGTFLFCVFTQFAVVVVVCIPNTIKRLRRFESGWWGGGCSSNINAPSFDLRSTHFTNTFVEAYCKHTHQRRIMGPSPWCMLDHLAQPNRHSSNSARINAIMRLRRRDTRWLYSKYICVFILSPFHRSYTHSQSVAHERVRRLI